MNLKPGEKVQLAVNPNLSGLFCEVWRMDKKHYRYESTGYGKSHYTVGSKRDIERAIEFDKNHGFLL